MGQTGLKFRQYCSLTLRFAFAGWFGGFIVVECEAEPVFERLVVGDRCGVDKEKALHHALGEIHRTRSGSLHHFVGEGGVESDHQTMLFDADAHLVIDHKAQSPKHTFFFYV